MKSIPLALNSAYYAAKDRYFVRKATPEKLNYIDLLHYNKLQETSGPQSSSIKDAYKGSIMALGLKYRMGLR